ncbi:hypothetical protein SNEBB_006168 [Seison nebaliae]|nr:hypothetical protein SNEBB_006168 [Seison nebaliae]
MRKLHRMTHNLTVSVGSGQCEVRGRTCQLTANAFVPPVRHIDKPEMSVYHNMKPYQKLSSYDQLFKIEEGYNEKAPRSDRRHARNANLYQWEEEKKKIIPTRSNSLYGHRHTHKVHNLLHTFSAFKNLSFFSDVDNFYQLKNYATKLMANGRLNFINLLCQRYGYEQGMSFFTQVAKITDSLYLSSGAAAHRDNLKLHGITCLMNISHEIPKQEVYGVESIKISIDDSAQANLATYFDKLLEKIHEHELKGGRTLVHCVAGVSRSATICIAYLIRYCAMRLKQAHDHVKSRRQFIRPNCGFWRQLIDYERKIYGVTSVRMIPSSLGMIPDIYSNEIRQNSRSAFSRSHTTHNGRLHRNSSAYRPSHLSSFNPSSTSSSVNMSSTTNTSLSTMSSSNRNMPPTYRSYNHPSTYNSISNSASANELKDNRYLVSSRTNNHLGHSFAHRTNSSYYSSPTVRRDHYHINNNTTNHINNQNTAHIDRSYSFKKKYDLPSSTNTFHSTAKKNTNSDIRKSYLSKTVNDENDNRRIDRLSRIQSYLINSPGDNVGVHTSHSIGNYDLFKRIPSAYK